MALSRDSFLSQFNSFKDKVMRASGAAFNSFQDGLPDEWEAYKLALRDRAIEVMSTGNWQFEDVGSGRILASVINAIEISELASGLRNNLVRWENRFGHVNRSHHKLLDAGDSEADRHRFERIFLDFFQRRTVDRDAFEGLRELVGNRYDLLAYLFFLTDSERFMPIAPTTFDEAFAALEMDLVTTRKCSWENYTAYNDALAEVQKALVQFAGIKNVRLIDAHSFCWMLVRLSLDHDAGARETIRAKTGKRDPGRLLGPREKSIAQMILNVEATVRSASGPPVEKTPKPKELRMNTHELRAHIEHLLSRQEGKCALTGIRLQFHEDGSDIQLLPSLDRKDSDGNYEAGNLQIVCRFVNFWKGASANEEFRRLLALVRGDDD